MRYNSESLEIKDLRSRNDVLYKDIKISLGLLITARKQHAEYRGNRNFQIRRSSYKVAYDWLGRTMKNNAILKIQYGGRHDVGEKRHCTSFKFREMRTLRKEYFKF